jgi:hypothetical protein
MPIQKYKNNIAYLFKRVRTDNTLEWQAEGTAFYCNRETVNKTIWNGMSNVSHGTTTELIKTTTQLEFEINDKISFVKNPNPNDIGLISEINPKPFMEQGNKHRRVNYYEYWITIK